jgi:hypothetical protein
MTTNGFEGTYGSARQEAIAAASRVIARQLEQVDGGGMGDGARERTADGRPGVSDLRAAAARSFDLCTDLFQRTFDLYADVLESGLRRRDESLVEYGATVPEVLLSGRAGEATTAPIWIHNSTDVALVGVRLRMTALGADDGTVLPATIATFEPRTIDVDAGGRAMSRLSAALPATARPAIYFGHALLVGFPHGALSLRVVVAP